jgi:hypothetical protein
MPTLRLATFNAENLFARYRFRDGFHPTADDGFTINDIAYRIHDEEAKRITAKAIRIVNAYVICLQEVESLPVLDRFNSYYLGGMKYAHRNVLTRLPASEQWTHHYGGGNEYHQLDYLLLSKGLAQANPGKPAVMRIGPPWRAQQVTEERLPGVGENDPKASDHAPLYMDVTLV